MPPLVFTEWDANSHFLALFAATALLKDELPMSLLLTGRPGEGKSALVGRFKQWPGHLHVSDFTSDGIKRALQSEPRLRMFILDELQRIFAHTFETVQNVTGVLISLMSGNASVELAGPRGKGAYMDLTDRRVGVLAAIPTDVLNARVGDMEATGLLSRFAFLSIVRTDDERTRVRRAIYRRDSSDLQPYPMPRRMPREPVSIAVSEEAARELEMWGLDAFAKADDRKHHMLTVLLRAVALLNGRKRAGVQDVLMLRRFEHHLRSLEVRAIATAKPIPPFRGPVSWQQ